MFLLQEWVPAVAGLQQRLTAGAQAVDIGCGGGRALCHLASAFPASQFVGYDLDEAALQIGRARAEEQGLSNIRFERKDVADLGLGSAVDVVLAVDAVHDQAAPEQVLRSARQALRPDGVLVLIEPTATGDLDQDVRKPSAVIGYATSLTHCVQVSLAEGGPALGGMWGSAGARALLASTGYTRVQEHRSPSDYTVYSARP
jgi:2-polyprenyl-3-methyl-5-hydroxy-6-metoxy-1,4-benzoquinol methylase